MGFTPLEGLVMGTRSGDIDPAIVTYIREKENLPQGKVNEILNKNPACWEFPEYPAISEISRLLWKRVMKELLWPSKSLLTR